MKYLILFFLLSLNSNLFAFDNDFKINDESTPFEFKVLFNSMKEVVQSEDDKFKLVALCTEINENFAFLPKQQMMLLIKTEVLKTTLEFKHSKVRKLEITSSLMDQLEKQFQQKKISLNSFSKWIWESIIAELKLKKQAALISELGFNPERFDGAKKNEAVRFQRYLNYLHPWIDKMESLDVTAFNKLSSEVGWKILTNLSDRGLLIKRFASTHSTNEKMVLINIPQKLKEFHPEDIKKIKATTAETLTEKSMKQKALAAEQIEEVMPSDLSTISDDVAQELEKKTETQP